MPALQTALLLSQQISSDYQQRQAAATRVQSRTTARKLLNRAVQPQSLSLRVQTA
jgi:hypothetical protein